MNKLNKELLERALVEGVKGEEYLSKKGLVLSFFWQLGKFYFVFPTKSSSWTDVCTKEECLAAKAEKEAMIDTKSEYDTGCYYEFSNFENFDKLSVGAFVKKADLPHSFFTAVIGGCKEVFKYIRPLTAKAGEIRKPKPLIGFINVDADGCAGLYSDKGIADISAQRNRIACIDLSQFNEGEGL